MKDFITRQEAEELIRRHVRALALRLSATQDEKHAQHIEQEDLEGWDYYHRRAALKRRSANEEDGGAGIGDA